MNTYMYMYINIHTRTCTPKVCVTGNLTSYMYIHYITYKVITSYF